MPPEVVREVLQKAENDPELAAKLDLDKLEAQANGTLPCLLP